MIIISVLAAFAPALHAGESSDAGKKKKTPHATIVVRPGPPVKPTQPAKPVGNLKSDWGGSAQNKR